MKLQALFFLLLYHFKIQEQETSNYEAFKSRKRSHLVCSYRIFRGLENPKIKVIVDRDIYWVQHYLVQALARYTSNFCVKVLQNSSIMKEVTTEWKGKPVKQQWKIKISGDAAEEENFKSKLKSSNDCNVINAKFSCEYFKKLGKEF